MARIKKDLNKTSQLIFNKFAKHITDYKFIDDFEKFLKIYRDILVFEIRNQHACSEKKVVATYMSVMNGMLNSAKLIDEDFFERLKIKSRQKLAYEYTNKSFDNIIDIYFNDVKREYICHPQAESDELEFIPENRDVFIKNNLKLVINCAKRYQNLGLPFEDLIQFGNIGLIVAFEKFDKNRANLRLKINNAITDYPKNTFTKQEAEKIINDSFVYSKNIETTIDAIPDDGFENKDMFHTWVSKHVKTAVFSSVAFKWIRAYILNELTKCGSIIHVPKTVKNKVDNETGEEVKQSITIINLDSFNPYTDDCYHDNELAEITQEEFIIEDERISNIEKQEALEEIVGNALYKLDPVDRRIVKKRFGIGLPYSMSVNDIAESESISVNKVKYSLQTSMKTLQESFSEIDLETINDLIN